MSAIFSAYEYQHQANRGKVQKLLELLKEYRKTAKALADLHWRYFFTSKSGRFNKNLNVKELKTNLSERYKYVCSRQVYGILESYILGFQRQFERVVLKSTLSEDDKRILLALNEQRAWFGYEKSTEIVYYHKGQKLIYQVSDWHKFLARKIFHHLLKTNRKPRFDSISMHLDIKVAKVEEKKEGKAKSFEYWLRLSTLEKGKPIYIPLKKNSYAEKVEGKFRDFVQLIYQEGKLRIMRVKELKKKEYFPETHQVAIDLGLRPLMATDRGDLLGRGFLERLMQYDRKIQNRQKHLQRLGIKLRDDEKYRKLLNKLRAFLKSEINRILNRVMELYKPAKLVVEKLDFRSPELSKRMNRLIQSFGKRFVKEKLNRLKELFGIEIVEVNPAYTSQECSRCGYVDERNRKSTEEFECRACGKRIHAQVNGARNIGRRSSLAELIGSYTPKKQVLKVLIKRFLERLSGCQSAPVDVLRSNPYFRDFLEHVRTPGV
ncbi:RNA-guided endonuclease TnpB family protein [Thermocrinis sp.]